MTSVIYMSVNTKKPAAEQEEPGHAGTNQIMARCGGGGERGGDERWDVECTHTHTASAPVRSANPADANAKLNKH